MIIMPDAQGYHGNLYLTHNVKDIVIVLALKVLNCDLYGFPAIEMHKLLFE